MKEGGGILDGIGETLLCLKWGVCDAFCVLFLLSDGLTKVLVEIGIAFVDSGRQAAGDASRGAKSQEMVRNSRNHENRVWHLGQEWQAMQGTVRLDGLRFHNHLDARITKAEWNAEEDLQLVWLHNGMGNKWAQIARQIKGR